MKMHKWKPGLITPPRVRSASFSGFLPKFPKDEFRLTRKGSKEGLIKIIKVNEGLIEGEKHFTATFMCDVFLGIPYAKPPLGELRFEKPQPPEPWEGVRKCNKYPNRAIQKEMAWDKVQANSPISEDCLYLNVFAPNTKDGTKFPVMFYIHGGGWLQDSAERYTPRNICNLLVSKGIIVVTIHYRLGFLGFLCTGDSAAPGNYAMFDMLAALKWVKANISAFGGDPDNITISGQSAGGASADLLSISPLSRGLFNKKIIMGGNSFCHWSSVKNEDIRAYCKKKAIRLGWKPRDDYKSRLEESHDMVRFYKSLPAHKLGTTMFFSKTIFTKCILPLAPVIDGEFLPNRLSVLRQYAEDVPSIIGGGENESLLFLAIGLMKGSEKEIENVFDVLAKKSGYTRGQIEEMARRLYNDSPQIRDNAKSRRKFFADLVSDVFANYANHRYISDTQRRTTPCFAYSFDYQSSNMWGWLQHVVPFTGGTHTSDVTYLFNCNYMAAPLPMNKTDKMVSEMTSTYFTNFVKTGNPNGESLPKWDPVDKTSENHQMLSFKKEPEMTVKEYDQRMKKLNQNLPEVVRRRTFRKTTKERNEKTIPFCSIAQLLASPLKLATSQKA